jgi:hypothetical protein
MLDLITGALNQIRGAVDSSGASRVCTTKQVRGSMFKVGPATLNL